jgi:hypothetical protein
LYSNRLSWSLQPNAFTLQIAEKRRQGVPLLDLTNSNPTGISDYPHAEIASIYTELRDFTYQPEAAGEWDARVAVSGYYREHGLDVSPDRILLTASTSEGYALLFKLLCDPGDDILVPTPSYPLFEYLAAVESVRPAPYSIHYDGSWYIDSKEVRASMTDRTRAIILVSPNNPTGSCLKKQEVSNLLALSRETSVPLISDEVFLDYPLDGAARLPSLCSRDGPLTFSLGGLSKSAGMPQMKLGWIVVNGDRAESQQAIARLELLFDTFLSVNTPVQKALAGLLQVGASIRNAIRDRVRGNYEAACRLLRDSAAHPLHAEAGWSVIIQLPRTISEEEWVRRLLDDGYCIVQPGYFFDLDMRCCIVLSLLTERNDFLQGLERIRELVARYA